MPAKSDANYETNAKFLLEIDGIAIASFEKVTMGDSEWGVISNRTGTDPMYKHTSSGLKTVTMITLEKHLRDGGAAEINEIITWHEAGSKDRRSGSLVMLDREDTELLRFNFKNAWVSKLTPPEMDASQENAPMVFTFDITVGTYNLASA